MSLHEKGGFFHVIAADLKEHGIGILWFLAIVLPIAAGAMVAEGAYLLANSGSRLESVLLAILAWAGIIGITCPENKTAVLFFGGGLATVIWKVAIFSAAFGLLIGFVPLAAFAGTTYYRGQKKMYPPVSPGTLLMHPAVSVVGMVMLLLTGVSIAALLFGFPFIFSIFVTGELLILKFLYVE